MVYILMRRASNKESWISFITYKELQGAQHALVNLSRGNSYEWDIFCAESITKRMTGDCKAKAPQVVKERTSCNK